MSVIVILIVISLSLALGFLACFVWAVNSGQYEDTLTPSMRILADEEPGPGRAKGPSASEPSRKST
ncbi:cbb3-type cytochrome oxidase assembly protein CcoS [bacterium]|nr:cbb3-type cytochrome oxidase assembly protein CcoS [bacterium]